MPTLTTNYSLNKPLVNNATDEDLWGTQTNTNWDTLDTLLGARTASKYGAVIVQNTTDNGFDTITSQGTSGQVLTSNGADALPSWQSIAAAVGSSLFPVGSYYMNETDSTNPGTLLGFGTWVAVSDKFIVARGGTYTGTGGAASVTLAQNNLPASLSFTSTCTESDPSEAAGTTKIAKGDISGSSVTATLAFTNSGGGTSFSIIPTYQAAYVWKRTV